MIQSDKSYVNAFLYKTFTYYYQQQYTSNLKQYNLRNIRQIDMYRKINEKDIL